jgi:hypothetical protein
MSIQIIDGFQVNTASPIDNRIVASGSAARNAIPYKYEGLRVFDTHDSVPYVWVNGAWQSENSSGVVGSGTTTFFPLFTSPNVIGDSLLYQDGGIIKTGDDGGGSDRVQISPYYGSVLAQGGFYGPGTSITNINGSNINSGSIPTNRLVNGSTGQVLISSSTNPFWSNTGQLSVGTASIASNVSIQTTVANSNHYLAFFASNLWTTASSGTNSNIRTTLSGITYNPSTNTLNTGALTVGNGSLSTPAISFNNNTGIYKYSTNGLGISTAGSEIATFNTDGIRHIDTSFGTIGYFVVGTGNLAVTTQLTISSASYDRTVYVYSSDNHNYYYISSGFFEISIFIGGQQIYSYFAGNDNNIRPSLGYNFILPAGLTSTVKIYKGNSLTWNSGTGPTIYANSLKFGL